LENFNLDKTWTLDDFTPEFNSALEDYLGKYKKFYLEAYNAAVSVRERRMYDDENKKGYKLNDLKSRYYNDALADLVKNVKEKNRIIEYNGELLQQVNPVFLDPKPSGTLDYRAHFFAPKKNLFGTMIGTYGFDILVIWVMTALFFVTLYFEVFRKLMETLAKVDFGKKEKR
jgi:hypothetical protein